MVFNLKNTLILLVVILIVAAIGLILYLYQAQFFEYIEPVKDPLEEPGIVEREGGDEFIMTNEFVRLWEPLPGQLVSSPLMIRGEARGTWFFEASFPVRLEGQDGQVLAEGYVSTQNDWMTEDFIYFEGRLDFEIPADKIGTLVLIKDNPSGLPEYDDELRVALDFVGKSGSPIITNFEECEKAGYPVMESYPRQCATPDGETFTEIIINECIITGCNKQVCARNHAVTTCNYEPEYSCLKYAVCEIQAGGECGWTEMPGYDSCIADILK